MLKGKAFLIFSVLLFYFCPAWAQNPLDLKQNNISQSAEIVQPDSRYKETYSITHSEKLFSPSVGQKFYEIAYELIHSNPKEQTTDSQAQQAIVFLTAMTNLDTGANYVLADMIELVGQHPNWDYSELVNKWLANYVDESADMEVMAKAVQYLIERLNSREQREKLLEDMLKTLGGKNAFLDSELATLLGLMAAEKSDTETAQRYFMQAFSNNRYNRLAFAKLVELMGDQIKPATYLEQMRLALVENPLDMEAALSFAEYAEQLQLYQTAADTYEYCADIFGFLHPSQALPAYIYQPWVLSCYNTQRNQHKCLEIVSGLRQNECFDLLTEAIASKAAAKLGDTNQANLILQDAEEKARNIYSMDNQTEVEVPENKCEKQTITAEQLAWFYAFVVQDANIALDWANKAYSVEPNSTTAASILAYSLVMSGQTNWAKSIVDNYPLNQIADLALAQIQLAEGQEQLAVKTLKSVISSDPGTLEAEQAKELLHQQGQEYIPPLDPDLILADLRNTFGKAIVPSFVSPDKIISVQLTVRGSKFSYGSDFGGTVAITNNSSEPFVINDEGLFKGNIKVDATVNGDISKEIPNLIFFKTRPASIIEPGSSILIPLQLCTGQLRQMLLTYPQASLSIEFTCYIDPVATDQSKVANRLESIKPAKVRVTRPGIELTSRFLRNRINSLSKGGQGQKINIAQLFAGFLMEQHAMANLREPLYKFTYADWMPAMLKSALLNSLTQDDWVAKVHTMTAMLPLPLDYELIGAVAENLNDTHWPPRLIAIYLLAENQGGNFGKVLDYTAEYDSNKFVRDMAVALGAVKPEEEQPAIQAKPNQSNGNSPISVE